MPCYDPQSDYTYRDVEKAREEGAERANELTRLLCGLCRRIEAFDAFSMDNSEVPEIAPDLIQSDPFLKAWWDAHKAFDLKREAEERAAASGLSDAVIAVYWKEGETPRPGTHTS